MKPFLINFVPQYQKRQESGKEKLFFSFSVYQLNPPFITFLFLILFKLKLINLNKNVCYN